MCNVTGELIRRDAGGNISSSIRHVANDITTIPRTKSGGIDGGLLARIIAFANLSISYFSLR